MFTTSSDSDFASFDASTFDPQTEQSTLTQTTDSTFASSDESTFDQRTEKSTFAIN